jgi:hypothetical protein
MRTHSTLLSLTAVVATATCIFSSSASAQQHTARSLGALSASSPHTAAAPCTYQDCAEDYSLKVVSVLFPYNDGQVTGPSVVTLVLENSGAAVSPASVIAIAPRAQLSLVNRMTVPVLEPGERTVIQVPVEIAPDGSSCIAVTISRGLSPTVTETVRFASTR